MGVEPTLRKNTHLQVIALADVPNFWFYSGFYDYLIVSPALLDVVAIHMWETYLILCIADVSECQEVRIHIYTRKDAFILNLVSRYIREIR